MIQNITKQKTLKVLTLIAEKVKIFDPFGIAAQSAYYFLFSIFPLLMFLVTLLPFFHIETGELIAQMNNSFLPQDLVETINQFLKMVLEEKDGSLSIVAFLLTIWSSSTAMNSIVKSINRIYEDQFTRNGLIFRLMSIGYTVGFVGIIILNFLVFTLGESFITLLSNSFPTIFNLEILKLILNLLKFFALPLLLFMSFYTLYLFSPSVKLKRIDVLPGSIFSALAFLIFSAIFSNYISLFSSSFTKYGIFSSLMLMMLWFFSIGLIIMFGAIINSAIRDVRLENIESTNKK